MMMTFPSAPAGATAADPTLPGVNAVGAPAPADGSLEPVGLPLLFGQLLDLAGLAAPATAPATNGTVAAAAPAEDGAADPAAGPAAEAPLAAMMPTFNFAFPVLQAAATAQVAVPTATVPGTTANGATPATDAGASAGQMRHVSLLATTSDGARQAAADAITAAGLQVTARPLPAATLPAAPVKTDELAQANVRTALPSSGTASAAPAATAAPVTAVAQDAGLASDSGNTRDQGQGQPGTSFRTVMAASAPIVADPAAAPDTVKLAGTPDQWQQPLRAALGDRLQMQLQRNNDHAVIRLDPPNLGSIEISIRHTAGALQVNLSASNSDVLRQLTSVSDNMRQDLSQRQFSDVAVTVSASSQRGLADGSGGGRQGEKEQQQRGPGRALSEGNEAPSTFAMLTERE